MNHLGGVIAVVLIRAMLWVLETRNVLNSTKRMVMVLICHCVETLVGVDAQVAIDFGLEEWERVCIDTHPTSIDTKRPLTKRYL